MAISFVGATIKAEQSTTAGTSQAGTAVSGVAVGDLILIETTASLATLPVWAQATITGWTIDIALSETAQISRILWRVADGTSADAPPAVTTSAAAHRVTQVAVYRGVDTTTPFIAKNGQVAAATQTSHATPSLTNTDVNAWAVYLGSARQVATPLTWTATASNKVTTERVDQDIALATTNNTAGTVYDSNGVVGATGAFALAATTSATTAQSCVWGAFLKPAAATSATTVSPGVATATSAANAPALTSTVTTVPGVASATASASAPALTSTVSVAPGAASSTASAASPALTSTVTVTPSSVAGQSGFGTGPFGSMSFGGGDSPAVAYAPTATVGAPTAGVTVTPGVATATAAALAPTVGGAVTVAPGPASSAASALSPAVSGAVTVTPGVAASAPTALAPAVSSTVTVIPGATSSTAAALAPVVTSTVTVSPDVATSTVAVYAPTVTATATVTPGIAVGSPAVYVPVVTALAIDNYHPHVPVTAILDGDGVHTATLTAPAASTATLTDATLGGFGNNFGLSFGAATTAGPVTAVITSTTATATLASNGGSTATLASNGVSTATLTEVPALAELQLV